MRLPKTSSPNFLYLDPARKYVNLNQFPAPGVVQVYSVLNRANETAIINAAGTGPDWSPTGLQATYAWRNNPGAVIPGTPGQPALTLTGTQFLEYDALASQFSGTELPMTMTCVMSCSAFASGTANTVWAVGASGATIPLLTLKYTSSNLHATETSSGGTTDAYASIDGGVHVATVVRSASSLTLRVDGVQVATTTIGTPAAQTYNTFCIGALDQNGTRSLFFNGSIGTMALYGGVADIDEVEAYLLLRAGVQRGSVFNG